MAAAPGGAVLILLSARFFTSVLSASPIPMTPSDPYIFQGQKLQLCCNVSVAMKNPPEVNGEVVFETWNTTVAVVTPSSAGTACIEPDTSERTPGAMFYCSYRGYPGYLGYQMVIIDGPEPTLSRPECTFQGMALTCQVKDIRSTLLRPENVTYRLYLTSESTDSRFGDTIECTGLVCRDGYCTCSLNRAQLTETYSLNLTVTYKPPQHKTMVWVNVSSLTPFNVAKVVPSSFSATSFTNACIKVSWSFSFTLFRNECRNVLWGFYNYDDRCKEDMHQELLVKSSRKMEEPKVLHFASKTRDAVICHGLRPFTEYNFTLRVRPSYSQVWSENSTTLTTLPAAPEGAPDVAPGFATNGTDGQIVLYWRAIPEERRNGPDLSYAVLTEVLDHDLSPCSGTEADDVIRTTSNNVTLRVGDRQGQAVTVVCVIPENQEGRSQNMTVLYLDHTAQAPEDVQAHFLSGSSDNVTVTITWRDVAEVHAVLWCLRPGITSLTCEEEVWWRNVESGRSQFVIGPMGRHSVGHLMYGVASQKSRDHVTVVSGFRWRTCVQERDKEGRVTRVFSCEGNPTAGADDQLTTWVTGSVLFVVFAVAIFTLLCCRAVRDRMRKFQQHGFCRPTDPPCLAPRHPGGTHHSHAMRFQDNIRRPPATIPASHVSGTSLDSLRPTDNPREGCNGSVSSELQPLTKLPSPAERSRPPSYIQVSIPDDSQDSSEDEETPLSPETLRPLRYPFLETKSWACDVISESTDSRSSVGCSDNSKYNHSTRRSPSVSSELQPLTQLSLPTELRGSGSGPMSSTQVSVGDNCEDNMEEETVSTSSGDQHYLRYHVIGTKMAASDSSSEAGCSGSLDNHVLTSSSSDGSFVNREDIADDQPTLLVTRYGHVTQTPASKVDRPPGFAEEALSPVCVHRTFS